jgi:hypothetical protein
MTKLLLGNVEFGMDVGALIQDDTKSKPSTLSRRTLKNRCSADSSTPSWHKTQWYPSCKTFFLFNTLLVLILSTRSNQPKI